MGYSTDFDVKRGDKVEHPRFGIGVVTNVDVASYSIPMVTARYDKGEIARWAGELTKKHDLWEEIQLAAPPK
jgi:hypothetical protein